MSINVEEPSSEEKHREANGVLFLGGDRAAASLGNQSGLDGGVPQKGELTIVTAGSGSRRSVQ
jgi:hypothetical protein